MIRKRILATALAVTLAVSIGCSRDEAAPVASGDRPAAQDEKPAKPDGDKMPAAPATDPQPPSAPSVADQPSGKPSTAHAGDPLFKDWPKPVVAIVATGNQMGYIEPCGCSGKENQKGGLSRRHNMLKKLAADGWPLVPVDVGGQVRRFGEQAELKFQATADALKTMRYSAVAFGADDLRLPAAALTQAAAAVDKQPSLFVAANAALFDFDQQITPRFRIVEAGKLKLGITAVIGASYQRDINNSDVKLKPPIDAIREVLPDLKAAKCDRLILLAHATLAESTALAKAFPEFDFVVTSGDYPEPPLEPKTVEGSKTRLIEVGQKGEFANVIGLFDDPQQPVRFQRVPLDAHWGESDEMKQVMVSYQDQLKLAGLAGLGIKPAAHPSGQTFVGAKVCGECHTKAFKIWKDTPHAKALDTLAHLDPPRNFDPECLSCHVTGWEPQKFYPYHGGYEGLDKTPLLAHNGCENCHGPGSDHAAAEAGDKQVTDKQKEDLRAGMRVAADANTCIQCHDTDNSVKFNFETYWPKVAHKGKD